MLDLSHHIILKLLTAAFLGGVIGLEREIRSKPAGLRTNMLICVGSALFTVLSVEMSGPGGGDPGRIAAQIITGIGFIGAGAIIRERGGVVGLTTAATIFVVASIGMAAGMGLYATAGFSTLLILAALSILGWFEGLFSLKTSLVTFRLSTPELEPVMNGVNRTLKEMQIPMQHFQVFRIGADFVMEFEAPVSHSQQSQVLDRFSRLEARCEVVSHTTRRE